MILLALSATAIPARAQTYTDLHLLHPGVQIRTLDQPHSPQGRDGDFYAESNAGGTGNGTVFKVSPTGTVTPIHSFDATDGSNAIGGMTLGTDGNLYGNTWSGGTLGNGLVFKITPERYGDGAAQLRQHRRWRQSRQCAGCLPSEFFTAPQTPTFAETRFQSHVGGGPDNFAYVLQLGRSRPAVNCFSAVTGNYLRRDEPGRLQFGYGTAFKMTAAGKLTVLHNFNNTDGNQQWPPGMVQMTNGKFYGTTELGGTTGDGVAFSVTSTGTFAVLHNFSAATDGHQALALTLANDGNAYGVAVSGGSSNCGTIFKVTEARSVQRRAYFRQYAWMQSAGGLPHSGNRRQTLWTRRCRRRQRQRSVSTASTWG